MEGGPRASPAAPTREVGYAGMWAAELLVGRGHVDLQLDVIFLRRKSIACASCSSPRIGMAIPCNARIAAPALVCHRGLLLHTTTISGASATSILDIVAYTYRSRSPINTPSYWLKTRKFSSISVVRPEALDMAPVKRIATTSCGSYDAERCTSSAGGCC
ncbi:hypothetical protein BD309DRAFT_975282 [Dichomitus squalens]|uniref:Uncharacterized protein n=1 Tax=Dichomitus squalens TaxID=114155 RepID=A0A4Q9N8Z0_9APHY|nr:hypothetical protein BD309DRAFT_975282 [Dichomitus squalens]TBU56544.1 hypothetical protein BD310DRAFT_931142 [Dichomitus squalens]